MVLFMIRQLVTHEAYFVEYFDFIWEQVCRDIFSMIDYDYILEYACNKIYSYDSPPSSNDYHQRASPHDLCLQNFDALMHDLGIQEVVLSSHSSEEEDLLKNFFIISIMSIFEGRIFPTRFSSLPRLYGLIKFCCKR